MKRKRKQRPQRRKPASKRTRARARAKKALHRYTSRVRKIQKQTGASYKEARQVAKRTDGKAVSTLKKILRAIRKEQTVSVYNAKRDSENGDGDASFAIQNMTDERGNKVHEPRINAALKKIKASKVTVEVQVEKFMGGVSTGRTKTLRREGVPKKDFFYAYHEMIREDFESDVDYGDYDGSELGYVTTGVAVR